MAAFIGAGSLVPFSTPLWAVDLLMMTEEWPPFNYSDPATGRITGSSTEQIREIARRSGLTLEIDIAPWARTYYEALHHADVCAFSTTLTGDRQPLFHWVLPLFEDDWTFFARASDPIRISRLVEARGYTVGVIRDDARHIAMIKLGGFSVEPVTSTAQNLEKLAAGRIDLVFSSAIKVARVAAGTGNRAQPVGTIRTTRGGLACNRAISENKIARMQAALDSMIADGTVEIIRASFQTP